MNDPPVPPRVARGNFDFNSDVDSLTDDNWLLNRFRIGVAIKPVDWLKIYAQGQDSRQWFSDRPNIPGFMRGRRQSVRSSSGLRPARVEVDEREDRPPNAGANKLASKSTSIGSGSRTRRTPAIALNGAARVRPITAGAPNYFA
jgi:hypothetical protein